MRKEGLGSLTLTRDIEGKGNKGDREPITWLTFANGWRNDGWDECHNVIRYCELRGIGNCGDP